MIEVEYEVLDSDGDRLGKYTKKFVDRRDKTRHERIQNGQPGIKIRMKWEKEDE